jgi:hypothetical protein
VVSLLGPNPLTGDLVVYNATRTSSERLGYALDASAANVGGVKGGLVYDLFLSQFTQWYASGDWYASPQITMGGEFEYYVPTFDGDSIFNYFTHYPYKTATGRLAIDATDQIDVAGSGGVRLYETDGDPLHPYAADGVTRIIATTTQTDVLANLAARYRYSAGIFGLRAMSQTGDRGHRQGADLYTERYFMTRRWMAEGRLSLYDWKDNLRPDRNAVSFGYVVGGGFRPSPVLQALVEWEHDMSRVAGQRFRLLAVVNVTVGK